MATIALLLCVVAVGSFVVGVGMCMVLKTGIKTYYKRRFRWNETFYLRVRTENRHDYIFVGEGAKYFLNELAILGVFIPGVKSGEIPLIECWRMRQRVSHPASYRLQETILPCLRHYEQHGIEAIFVRPVVWDSSTDSIYISVECDCPDRGPFVIRCTFCKEEGTFSCSSQKQCGFQSTPAM